MMKTKIKATTRIKLRTKTKVRARVKVRVSKQDVLFGTGGN